ncbi:MAG: xanthine dehydrogenase family protein molybdopterin-binding subunit [Rhodospirillaceae bacterium]|nr:xanthine dehydrogenase family protein molybdopterin-binding subunit [Rhodospirillaceae bacterium]
MATPLRVIGSAAPRTDADAKITGAARYTVDIDLPRMLHARTLRSPHPHARLTSVNASRARQYPGVHAVVTRNHLEGLNPTYGYFIKDQPIVAIDKVRYIGDPVAAVAAETERAAVEALALIDVKYEVLPTVGTIAEAMDKQAPDLFESEPMGIVPAYGQGASAEKFPAKNNFYQFRYRTGDAATFAEADHVFEDEFHFSRLQHYHLEPFVAVAAWDHDSLEVWSSCQNPFPLRKELARVFNHPEQNIRVHVPLIGAGYGAKNNCKAEPIAVLLARLSGRPVRHCMTHEENFLTQSQHAAILRLKTGVKADGTFVARQSHILLDSGAYSDASPLVAEKAGYRIPGPYRWRHIDTVCDCIMTNTTPAGPFRGFGGTQTSWASESQIDMIARRLDINPYDIRKQNFLALGEPFVPGESGMDSDLHVGLDIVAEEIGYHKSNRAEGRGIGLAVGFKDSGGVNKPATVQVKATTTGGLIINCGTTEIGQGVTTAFTRIVAEIFNCPVERVRYAPIDTDITPFDQGTNASSALVVMGQALEIASRECLDQVMVFASEQLDCPVADLVLDDWVIKRGDEIHPLQLLIMGYYGGTGFEFVGRGFFKPSTDHRAPLESQCVSWEIGWGAAEVEVDPETGRVDLLKLVVSGDAGRAIHPDVCRGQDEGAAVMAIGQSLFEGMRYRGAVLENIRAVDYRVPLARDLPIQFTSITQEQGHGPGPFGSKGMGEAGILPVASAIANAIEDACGARITSLPITPEKVLSALDNLKGPDET